MKVRNEVWVGALTILSIVIFILGYSFLKGEALFQKNIKLTMGVDNLARLQISDPVMMNGYQVGKVADMSPQIEGKYNILVDINLNKDVRIPNDSRFVIQSADLFGEKEIEIREGKSSNLFVGGELVDGNVQADMMGGLSEKIDPIAEKASNLMSTLDSTISALNLGGKDGAKLDLSGAFDDLSATLDNLNSVTGKLDKLFNNQSENIEGIIENAAGLAEKMNSYKLDSILVNIDEFSNQLSNIELESVVASLKSTMENVNEIMLDIKDSNGTLNKVIKDDALYVEIDSAINALDALLVDIKQNPKRYINISIFGGRKKNQNEESPEQISLRP